MGGDIVTVDDKKPTAEAVAVKDGKIIAVGTRAEVEKALNGPATRVSDLAGKTMLPGFVDAHSHYISSLTVAHQVNVYAPLRDRERTRRASWRNWWRTGTLKRSPKGRSSRRTATTTP
jgi:predicted amidohydrolase YtcJ